MSLQVDFEGSFLVWRDSVTDEAVLVGAPVFLKEDFLGHEGLLAESGSPGRWETIEGNLNTAIALANDEVNGALSLALDSDAGDEMATLCWGNQLSLSIDQGLVIEIRAKISVLPTSGTSLVLGIASNADEAPDDIIVSAWFRLEGNGSLLVESDDHTNENDDVSTGETLTTDTWHIFRIDCTNPESVKFYLNGVRMAGSTTFDLSDAASPKVQPYVSLMKPSGTSVGTVLIDYVAMWQNRS
jgi:concanavalin A-like lectin/glucanase superfamily protein